MKRPRSAVVAAVGWAVSLAIAGPAALGAPGTEDAGTDGLVLASAPEIGLEHSPWDGHPCSLKVTGLPADSLAVLRVAEPDDRRWRRVFSIYTGEPTALAADQPAMLGSYAIRNDTLRFFPRFPWVPGLTYHARFDGAAFDALAGRATGRPGAMETFSLPPSDAPPTRVEAVYPSAGRLPSNTLRIYVQFSAPMLPKEVSRHVRLFDDTGAEVELPFVEIEQGLWDPERRRLTLFLHPGRIKRGVGPHENMGPPLQEGRLYRLAIDRGLRDAAGRTLEAGFEKRFAAVAPDRRSPDTGRWVLLPPATGRREALGIEFPEPLDHGLLGRLIDVQGPSGESVVGEVTISRQETRWELIPERAWEPGSYVIRVHSALEDLAGNNLAHRFEEPQQPLEPAASVSIPLVIP